MSSRHDPTKTLARFHEVTNAQDFVAIEAMFAPDVVYVSQGVGGRIEGRDAVMTAFRSYFEEYPDQEAEDKKLEALSPNSARSEWSLTGTSTKTGVWRERHGAETITLDGDGLIVRVDVEG